MTGHQRAGEPRSDRRFKVSLKGKWSHLLASLSDPEERETHEVLFFLPLFLERDFPEIFQKICATGAKLNKIKTTTSADRYNIYM